MTDLIAVLAALTLSSGASQSPPAPRPETAVIVVTLDEARQAQIRHGRDLLRALGDERFGSWRFVEPTLATDGFASCEDDRPEHDLDFCVRLNLNRAWVEGAAPHMVVVFTDEGPNRPDTWKGPGMRALCYGRGAEAADATAQDVWLWPGSARMHGVNDWEADKVALAGCIAAALSETPGTPRPKSR
jgi:hypothetical protein